MRTTIASSLALLLAGAGCFSGATLEGTPCPDGGTSLSYESFGRAFFDRHCQGCHATNATDRQGAPAAYAFDTALQVRTLGSRIFARAAADNDSMPPGPEDPSPEERRQLAEWLACGAP